MDVVNRPLIYHHGYGLARDNLRVLTDTLLIREFTAWFVSLVWLMILTMSLSMILLLNSTINSVLLMLLLLYETVVASWWSRYLVIWLLELLLSELILAYLTLILGSVTCSFLFIIGISPVTLNLVRILSSFVYELLVWMIILSNLLLICLLLIEL